MRPKIRVFERYRVNVPAATQYQPGEGFFAQIELETELRPDEEINKGVARALNELAAATASSPLGSGVGLSLEDRLRKMRSGK